MSNLRGRDLRDTDEHLPHTASSSAYGSPQPIVRLNIPSNEENRGTFYLVKITAGNAFLCEYDELRPYGDEGVQF